MATTFTIVNPSVGCGIALVEGDDAAAVEKAATAISKALRDAPANRGITNSQPLGEVVSDKGGVTVTLFVTATPEEATAVRSVK